MSTPVLVSRLVRWLAQEDASPEIIRGLAEQLVVLQGKAPPPSRGLLPDLVQALGERKTRPAS